MKKQTKHLTIYEVAELRRYQDMVEKRIGDFHRRFEGFKWAIKSAMDTIEIMTRKQLELGVAVISAVETNAAEQLRMPIETYCKAIQHQANKPFVCMTERTNSPTLQWSLFVPKLKDQGMENLVAPLLIIGKPKEIEQWSRNPIPRPPRISHLDDGIYYESDKRGWIIWFVGEENEEMRLHWLEMCRTEHVFRSCLRMPAAPVDLSVYGL